MIAEGMQGKNKLAGRTLLSAILVRQGRQRLSLTQTQAAQKAGWSSGQCWSKLELRDSDVRVGTLVLVSRVLGCRMEALLVDKPLKSSHDVTKSRQRPGRTVSN